MAGTRVDAVMVHLPDGERKALAKTACEVAGVNAGSPNAGKNSEGEQTPGHNRFIGRDPKIKTS